MLSGCRIILDGRFLHSHDSVSDDDDSVSHLVPLYFTWNDITLNWIDPELFLMDMKKGQLGLGFVLRYLSTVYLLGLRASPLRTSLCPNSECRLTVT